METFTHHDLLFWIICLLLLQTWIFIGALIYAVTRILRWIDALGEMNSDIWKVQNQNKEKVSK